MALLSPFNGNRGGIGVWHARSLAALSTGKATPVPPQLSHLVRQLFAMLLLLLLLFLRECEVNVRCESRSMKVGRTSEAPPSVYTHLSQRSLHFSASVTFWNTTLRV